MSDRPISVKVEHSTSGKAGPDDADQRRPANIGQLWLANIGQCQIHDIDQNLIRPYKMVKFFPFPNIGIYWIFWIKIYHIFLYYVYIQIKYIYMYVFFFYYYMKIRSLRSLWWYDNIENVWRKIFHDIHWAQNFDNLVKWFKMEMLWNNLEIFRRKKKILFCKIFIFLLKLKCINKIIYLKVYNMYILMFF